MTTTAFHPVHETPSGRRPDVDVLVSPQWLAAHLDDPNVTVVEIDVSPAAYDDWHIDGAALWNVYTDIKDGDYRLVPQEALERLVARSGIGPDTTVVFYGYAPAMGFWLMTLLGHARVRILDCSRDTWRSDGLPWTTVVPEPTESAFRCAGEDDRVRADAAAVRAAIGSTDVRLLDVRSSAEFVGERFWPSGAPEPRGRAGHVPSAVHQPIDAIYDDRGAFRTADELREQLAAHLDCECELITYCAIGGRAATAWFVLTQLLGRDHVRVYDGSWAEWGRGSDTPVAVGAIA